MHHMPFSLLIKPAGADCNLHCGYCFYLSRAGLYPDTPRPRMSLATLERLYRAYFAIPMPVYSFGWQGGEPTLMGRDFFAEALAMQRRMAPRGATVTNGLQTNGTLLTPAWAQLLREHKVLVGLSIDGPPQLHNGLRRVADGGGQALAGRAGDTAERVAAAVQLLRGEKVACNALTVVGPHNVHAPHEIYAYLRGLGLRHMQFIPLVEEGYSVNAQDWGRFLIAIFRRWFPRDVRRVSIRHHDSLLEYLVSGRYNVCTMSGACGGHLVIEHNGDIYPCDFYVDADLRLGNVHTGSGKHGGNAGPAGTGDNPLVAALEEPRNRTFMARPAGPAPECRDCRYRELCNGDCPRLWRSETGGASAAPRSALCEGWTAFFDDAIGDLVRLSRSAAELQYGPGSQPRIPVDRFAPRAGAAGNSRPAGGRRV